MNISKEDQLSQFMGRVYWGPGTAKRAMAYPYGTREDLVLGTRSS